MNVTINPFHGYELLDAGNERKLERFGKFILDRPCSQAIWPKNIKAPWNSAHAAFSRTESGQGDWEILNGPVKETWRAKLDKLTFEIRLTGFGNVGLFPEHAAHWKWLSGLINARKKNAPRVLNLFAYTGGASIVCAHAGATVTHVDAAKSVNGWAIQNAKQSGVEPGAIRFLAEDALKFAKKEIRRNRTYDGIILDPPTFGRGAKGEVWKIERDFHPLVHACKELLSDKPLFMLLTSHSPGITPVVLQNLMGLKKGHHEGGEMLIKSNHQVLPAGCYARWSVS